jgi:predicted ATP-grasp superfamily ATP-dependent carboligase
MTPDNMGPSLPEFQPTDVLILGASARAAAMSAVRAGFRVWALDLFGDEDLIETAHQYHRIKHYRDCFPAIADWPMMPCLATGALENHPRLIERLAKERPIWGTPAEVVRKVRDPGRLCQMLERAGRAALDVWPGKSPPVADGRWMLKPKQSAGGKGVFVWDEEAVQSPEAASTLRKPHYFQKRAEGEAASAVFLSEWNQITFVGTSRLLYANPPGPRFGYGGAIGPVELADAVTHQLMDAGRILGAAFGLRGLWGLDFLHDDSQVFITEVNPRYTASVELYEHAYGTALLAIHRRACEGWMSHSDTNRQPAMLPWTETRARSVCVGKAVIYSPSDFTVPPWNEWTTAHDVQVPELRILADRPAEGSECPKGFPICSLFASGATERECRLALADRTKALITRLGVVFPGLR